MPSYRRKRRRLRPQFLLFCILLALILTTVILLLIRAFSGPDSSGLLSRPLPGEGVEVPDYVEADLLPVNKWSRPGTALEAIDGVVIHYIGNPGTSAEANRNYFVSLASGTENVFASSHFIVGLEGEVVQCVPLTEIAHASNTRNLDTVSVEVCHPDETGEFSSAAYDRAVELTVWLCHAFGLDPEEDVIRHYDVTGKHCPKYFVDHPEAWEQFLTDTAEELASLEKLEAAEDAS